MAEAVVAAERARQEVAEKLGALLAADVDAQRSTPLAVVRCCGLVPHRGPAAGAGASRSP